MDLFGLYVHNEMKGRSVMFLFIGMSLVMIAFVNN